MSTIYEMYLNGSGYYYDDTDSNLQENQLIVKVCYLDEYK